MPMCSSPAPATSTWGGSVVEPAVIFTRTLAGRAPFAVNVMSPTIQLIFYLLGFVKV
jgi:hypothetical protein